MADGLDLTEIMRRAVQANAKFYKGWLDLSLEYFRGISEIFGGEVAAPEEPGLETGAGVLVLEAEAGAAARGAFLVTNDLGRTMKCELVASDFTDSRGASIRAQPTFDPPTLELAPGEQRVVHAVIPIESELHAGVAYTGEFAIKGMEGFSVPVVLRRMHRVGEGTAGEKTPAGEKSTGGVRNGETVKPAQPAGVKTVSGRTTMAPGGGAKRGAQPARRKRAGKQKD